MDWSIINDDLTFLLGNKSNEKAILIDFIKETFGCMAKAMSSGFFTKAGKDPSSPTSGLISFKNVRLATIVESELKNIKASLIKMLSGYNSYSARERSKKNTSFDFKTKIIVACNSLPSFTDNNYSVWRRIRICLYTPNFVENSNSFQKKINTELASLTSCDVTWRQTFMNIILERRKLYNNNPPKTPERLLNILSSKKKKTLAFKNFLKERIVETNDLNNFLTKSEIYEAYMKEAKEKKYIDNTSGKIDSILFIQKIESHFLQYFPNADFSKYQGPNGTNLFAWRGFALKPNNSDPK